MRYRLVAFVLAFTVFAPWCEAVADDDGGDTAAVAANRGFKLGLAPTSLLPIRPLAPFGAFGAGFGGLSNPGESGLACSRVGA